MSRTALIQTHCHHHAIIGTDADQAVLRRAGVDARFLDSGCCGLAGNFGFEAGHYEVSEACAEPVLLPALRDADPDDVVLADGFSCRTQIEQGDSNGRQAVHLAELLRAGLTGDHAGERPERQWAQRPTPPSRGVRIATTAIVGLSSAGALAAVIMAGRARWRARRR